MSLFGITSVLFLAYSKSEPLVDFPLFENLYTHRAATHEVSSNSLNIHFSYVYPWRIQFDDHTLVISLIDTITSCSSSLQI